MDNFLSVHSVTSIAEQDGLIIRPSSCETCLKPKVLIRHHRDYSEALDITWLCHSCHKKEHYANKELKGPYYGKRKPVQLDEKTHGLIQKESIRQSTQPGFTVTMGGVIAQLAVQLTKRRRRK